MFFLNLVTMLKLTKNIKLCLGFLLAGFLIHLAAFSSPYWNFFTENNDSQTKSFRLISLGLWQACFKQGDRYWCQGYTAFKGFTAARIFECLSLIGYAISMILVFAYEGFPVYGTMIFIVCLSTMCATVISGICGILCWAAGSGSTVQYNLSWSFGFAISSVIISVVPAFFLTMERISNSQIKRRDSLEEPEKNTSFI